MRQISNTLARQKRPEPHLYGDKISCAMAFLRSAERGDVVGQLRNAKSYVYLGSIADAADPFLREKGSLQAVRDHIIELASVDISTQMQELKNQKLDPTTYRMRKENLLVRLKRMMPGSTSGLNALEDAASGGICTEPRDMARLLTEHWGRVLTSKPISSHLLERWLQDLPQKLAPIEDGRWLLTRDHVLESIGRSHETTPGPDGIPYKAFKKLGKYASEYLFDAAEDLQETQSCPDQLSSFNHASLCCLPKSASHIDPVLGDIHSANLTRPLSIVNTDNRLIANAYRIMIEPIVNERVSGMQRVFLQGRSMASNVIDIAFEAMKVSLSN